MKKPQSFKTIFKSHPLKNQNGSVLLFVFIFIGFITIIGVMALKSTSEDKIISSNAKKNVQSFYLAEAGIEKAKAVLKDMTLYEIYETSQGNGGYLFPTTALGDGSYNVELSGELSGSFNPGYTFNAAAKDIETTKLQDIIIEAKASHIAWDCYDKCEIQVEVKISWNNGSSYNDLFGGLDIDGEEEETCEDIDVTTGGVDTHIDFRFLVTFNGSHGHDVLNKEFNTNDDKDHFIYLKAGDPVEDLEGFAGQDGIIEVLSGEERIGIDLNNRVQMGENDLLILADFNDDPENSVEGDYQDAILLVTFGSDAEVEESRTITVTSTGQQTTGVEQSIEIKVKKSKYDDLQILSWREVD